MAKVIHVHIFSRPRGMKKDYYFSSITAVLQSLLRKILELRNPIFSTAV